MLYVLPSHHWRSEKVTLADNENPSEVICQRQAITGVGNLKEVLSLRKVNLSFNPISSLKGIDQLKELRHLSAYCCRITNIDHLGYNYLQWSSFPSHSRHSHLCCIMQIEAHRIHHVAAERPSRHPVCLLVF